MTLLKSEINIALIGSAGCGKTSYVKRILGKEFEKRYIGQGPTENRTMMETLDLGWELLGLLPKEELDRIDTKLIEKYWKDTRDTMVTEE